MSDFSLIETMRFSPATGILRRRLHLARLANSARVLGFPSADDIGRAVDLALADQTQPLRVRLEYFTDGRHQITTAPFQPLADDVTWTVRIARSVMLKSTDPILRHKTSRREHYEQARAEYAREDADEVLLLNDRNEVCEGTITNLFVDDGSGVLLTPPLSGGCLAGILRTELICSKRARSRRLTIDDLRANPFYVGNSLRGLIRAKLKED